MNTTTITQALEDDIFAALRGTGYVTHRQAREQTDAIMDLLSQRTEQQAGAAEPVAWRYRHKSAVEWEYTGSSVVADQARSYTVEPLYAGHPPAAEPKGMEPLSEEEIVHAALKFNGGFDYGCFRDGVRFAEQAHGARVRSEALEEAAKVCDQRYMLRTIGGFPREASAALALAKDIRALKETP